MNLALSQTVPDYINTALATADGKLQVPTYENWFLDWTTMEPAVITDTTVQLGATGIVFDSDIGETEWSTAFPDMPYHDDSESAEF